MCPWCFWMNIAAAWWAAVLAPCACPVDPGREVKPAVRLICDHGDLIA